MENNQSEYKPYDENSENYKNHRAISGAFWKSFVIYIICPKT